MRITCPFRVIFLNFFTEEIFHKFFTAATNSISMKKNKERKFPTEVVLFLLPED